ncbi:hypothetical protein GZH46_00155, partial [Fragariocoptes setiger]
DDQTSSKEEQAQRVIVEQQQHQSMSWRPIDSVPSPVVRGTPTVSNETHALRDVAGRHAGSTRSRPASGSVAVGFGTPTNSRTSATTFNNDNNKQLQQSAGVISNFPTISSPAHHEQSNTSTHSQLNDNKRPQERLSLNGGLQTSSSSAVAKSRSAATSAANESLNRTLSGGGSVAKVPKLLLKPMRPAKYSLNGYIPKPSLTIASRPSITNNEQPTSTITSQQQQQSWISHSNQSKDLDSSSTTNELFSRRRGGYSPSVATTTSISSDGSPVTWNKHSNNNNKSYLNGKLATQSQQPKSQRQHISQSHKPTLGLSQERAMLIKAKLGLLSDAASEPKSVTVTPMSGTEVASPNSSIPKTDFECSDKTGRFMTGVFADVATNCRVWHLCASNRKHSFQCPAGTQFNQKLRICDWRYNVKCGS